MADGTTLDLLGVMDTHAHDEMPAGAPAFVQVLYIGRFTSAALVAALRRDGVGVLAAFDHERGALLLTQFRPDAILCASGDVAAVRGYANRSIPVIPVDDETSGPSPETTTSGNDASAHAALADRIRSEITWFRHQVPSTPGNTATTNHV